MILFLLNILFCCIIGFSIAFGIIKLFFAWKKGTNLLVKKLQGVVAQKIQAFLEKIKDQVPLSKMVLHGEMERKLKKQAELEMLEAIPELEKLVLPFGGILGALIGVCLGLLEWLMI